MYLKLHKTGVFTFFSAFCVSLNIIQNSESKKKILGELCGIGLPCKDKPKNRKMAKTCQITRENSRKSRKNVCHYTPTPNSFLQSFPLKSTCNFPPLSKVWANLKMVLLRAWTFWIFEKQRSFSDFTAFLCWLSQFCHRHLLEW